MIEGNSNFPHPLKCYLKERAQIKFKAKSWMNSIKEGIVKYKREFRFTLKKPAWVNSIKEGIVNYNSLK